MNPLSGFPSASSSTCYLCGDKILPLERTRFVIINISKEEGQRLLKGGRPLAKAAIAHFTCVKPVTLTCVCCGYQETFKSCEEAFQAGWDEPTHLPSWPTTCSLCPGVASLGLIDHSGAHKRWKKEGRPQSFKESMTHGDMPPL